MLHAVVPSSSPIRASTITERDLPWLRTWGISACGIRPLAAQGGVDLQVGPARFSLVLEGSCRPLDARKANELLPGDGFQTVSGMAHALLATSATWVLWVTWIESPRTNDGPFKINDWRALVAAFHGLDEAHQRGEEPAIPLWTALFGRTLRGALTAMDPRLNQMMTVIACDPSAPWQLSDLAGLVTLGAEQLRRLCHEHIGVSPMELVAHQRLHRAAILLTTSRSLAEIATLVGYGNQFNLSTAFKRVFGLSPAHWRQRLLTTSSMPAKAGSGRWRRLG